MSRAPAHAVPAVAAAHMPAIHGMFFLSGLGALVFQTVWFSQTGLVVGNTVWSAALWFTALKRAHIDVSLMPRIAEFFAARRARDA